MNKPVSMYTLGLDIGSSAVKASLLEVESGRCAGSASFPEQEMKISAPRPGWAEQDPEEWWRNALLAVRKILNDNGIPAAGVAAIGIAYQMHGLVAVDRSMKPLRPAIIWCDSRAVESGEALLATAGEKKCFEHLLNAPGNFTLSKLYWMKHHEPVLFDQIYRILLPGDYIALRMTGEATTTMSGLSEGILWDFRENAPAEWLMNVSGMKDSGMNPGGIYPGVLPPLVPTFGIQGRLTPAAAAELGLPAGIPVTYRAGDQPNNAFSLHVMEPGETAATAGTSGVVYGVTDRLQGDPLSRVNAFAHVNHSAKRPRVGILLCINGTGISNSWLRRMTGAGSFGQMNELAATVPPGSEGLLFLPFGNGSERMLRNRHPGAAFLNLDLTRHHKPHLFRAVQEGIAFAFRYGMKIMEEAGMKTRLLRAGDANLFRSELFCSTLSSLQEIPVGIYNTDGALGAARGAALGLGLYRDEAEALASLTCLKTFLPDRQHHEILQESYERWEQALSQQLTSTENP